jgi:hypothetical protein
MPESGISPELIEEEEAYDYAFVGDITEVICFTLFSFHFPNSFSSHNQIILTENTNVHRNPCIIASGITGEFDSANLTFTLTPSQYITLPHTILECPISCFIDSDSKKWKNKKPMPISGTTISITGILTKIKRDFNHKPTFEIELDNIAYLGRQSGGLSTSYRMSLISSS